MAIGSEPQFWLFGRWLMGWRKWKKTGLLAGLRVINPKIATVVELVVGNNLFQTVSMIGL
jgi:hypothetical protein